MAQSTVSSITLVNVGTWPEQRFDLAAGVNVLVGDTDAGKSNVRRALQWFLYDDAHWESLLREGAASAEVRVEFSDGVAWTRCRAGRGCNGWTVGRVGASAVEYHAARDGVPPGLRERFGLLEVAVEGNPEPVRPHVHGQDDPKWFISSASMSPAQRTRTLAMLRGFDVFERAGRDVERELSAAQGDAETHAARAAELDAQAAEYAWVDAADLAAAEVEERQRDAESLERRFADAERLSASLRDGERLAARYGAVADTLTEGMADLDALLVRGDRGAERLAAARALRDRRTRHGEVDAALSAAERSHSCRTDALAAAEAELADASGRVGALRERRTWLERLASDRAAWDGLRVALERQLPKWEREGRDCEAEARTALRAVGRCWTCGADTTGGGT